MTSDLDASAAGITADNLRAAGSLYFAAQLEALHAFDVVARIVEQFSAGLLPIGAGGGAADRLRRYASSGEQLVMAERTQLFWRVFGAPDDAGDEPVSQSSGLPAGVPSGLPNREFAARFLTFVSVVAIGQGRRGGSSPAASVLGDPVTRAAARSLAANVSAHVAGLESSQVTRLEAQVAAVVSLLSDPEITHAFGARDMWQVIDTVNGDELGGAVNAARHRQRADAGNEILRWLAAHSEHSGDAAANVTSDLPGDQWLHDAVVRWLRAGGAPTVFCGAKQTGKTMAARALAAALSQGFLRVDLGEVVSKFIGETEKNLDAIFARVERSGALLLLDEADALFGERTAVADAHDRFAEEERARCLRRIEAHNGVVILESRSATGTDWHQRLAGVVRFPLSGSDS